MTTHPNPNLPSDGKSRHSVSAPTPGPSADSSPVRGRAHSLRRPVLLGAAVLVGGLLSIAAVAVGFDLTFQWLMAAAPDQTPRGVGDFQIGAIAASIVLLVGLSWLFQGEHYATEDGD